VAENPFRKIHVESLSNYVEIQNLQVLIVGVGNGEEAELILEKGAAKVVGIDMFIPPIIFRNPLFHSIQAECANLPLADNTFDIVFSHATFEHIIELNKSFLEIERVLKPGGICYVVASPLWFSPEGHHRADRFKGVPWFHVQSNQENMLKDYSKRYKDVSSEVKDIIKWVSETKELNRKSAEDYIEATNQLKKMKIHVRDFDQEKNRIPRQIRKRAKGKISELSLRAWTFTYIATKEFS
jgi:SAM-dependent methyltransferase